MNTKNKILQIANKLILEKGYNNISLTMIADEVGIKKASIYHHFDSKDVLYEEVFLISVKEFKDKLDVIIESSKKPEEKVKEFLITCIDPSVKKVNFKDFLLERIKDNFYDKHKDLIFQKREEIFKKIDTILETYTTQKKVKTRKISLAIIGTIGILIADRILNNEQITKKDMGEIADEAFYIIFNKF